MTQALGPNSVVVAKIPACDFCGEAAKYDGATKLGPWAFMCEEDFKINGYGLGTGRGQVLVLRTEEKEDD